MSPPSGITWSKRRWPWWLALALGVQLALLFWLSGPGSGPRPRFSRQPVIHFVDSHKLTAAAPGGVDEADPTLFALANPRGFSGSAWLRLPPFAYAPGGAPEPLQWLSAPIEELADDFSEYVQTNSFADEIGVEQFQPVLARPDLPAPVVLAATRLVVEDNLKGRALVMERNLPQAPESVLTDSVVRVAVDPRGMVISAALLSSCGLAKADQDALTYARALRFAPAGRDGSGGQAASGAAVCGKLVFRWAQVRWDHASAAATTVRN